MHVTEADDAGRPHDAPVDVFDLEFVAVDASVALLLRVDLRRAAGATRFLAAVLRPGTAPVVVIDHDLPLARQAFEFRAPAVWVELVREVPLEHWTVGLEAFALAVDGDDPVTPDSVGVRVPFGLDLDLETAAAPEMVADGGFSVEVAVHGEVLVGDDAYEVAATGVRRRRWDGRRPASAPLGGADPVPVGELWVRWPDADGEHPIEGRAWFGGPAPGWRWLARQVGE